VKPFLGVVSAGLVFGAAALPVLAEDASTLTAVHPDGSVTISGVTYPSMSDWHRSAEFRESGARCGTPEPAEMLPLASPTDCSLTRTSILPEYEPDDVLEIPVVFHVIENASGQGRLSEALIQSQLDILNEDFEALAGTPGGTGNAGAIRFVFASVDPDGNDTVGFRRVVNDTYYRDGSGTKTALNWNPRLYFNIYTNDPGNGLLGYATFPQQSAGTSTDGVVLSWRYVGRNAPTGGIYNQGRTGTHEVGHYLGLLHTFQGGCGTGYTAGDLIADTQAEAQEHYDCNVNTASGCGAGLAPIRNYMNYTNDTCMTHFTPEQVNRMRCSVINYRRSMLNKWPVADFTFTTTDGYAFTLVDASSDENDEIVLRQWDFGDGSTGTGSTVDHTFAEGTYEVSLLVMDASGARRRVVKTVVADPPPIAAFRSEPDGGLTVKFFDESTDPNGEVVAWEWDFGDGTTSTEQNPSHLFEAVGTYPITLVVTDEAGATAFITVDLEVAEDTGGGCGCAADGRVSGRGMLVHLSLAFGVALLVLRRRRRRG
jgi:PKD repeat protein